jgi:glycosyltransferase involved in cell wall biosynthesis
MEAMACGAVPVTTDCGDMADIVGESGSGELLPVAASTDQFADAVLRFLDNPKLLAAHSATSIAIVEREHSFASAEAEWRKILDRIAPRG